jgi:hypothetical protein
VVAALAAAVLATAGSAALPGLRWISATSESNSNFKKDAIVRCVIGEKLLGVGGRIVESTNGKLALTNVYPLPDAPTNAQIIGHEIAGGTGLNWEVRGYGICAKPTAAQQVEIVQAHSGGNSLATKFAVANCPSGKKVVGAGGRVSPVSGKTVLDEITPISNLTGVTVVGVEVGDGTDSNWGIYAYAICAKTTEVPGLTYVSATSALDSSSPKSASASCPTGKKLTGGGGQVNITSSGKAVLNGIRLSASLGLVEASGIEPSPGTGSSWSVKAIAICATP